MRKNIMKKGITLEHIAQIVMLPGLVILLGLFVWFRLLKHEPPTMTEIGVGWTMATFLMPASLICGSTLMLVHLARQYVKKRQKKMNAPNQLLHHTK